MEAPFDGLLVSRASQDSGGYTISRQKTLELYLGCHTCWLSYIGMPVVQTNGRTVTWWVDHHIFLDIGLRSRFARVWSSAMIQDFMNNS